jgi:hypothetical protein
VLLTNFLSFLYSFNALKLEFHVIFSSYLIVNTMDLNCLEQSANAVYGYNNSLWESYNTQIYCGQNAEILLLNLVPHISAFKG